MKQLVSLIFFMLFTLTLFATKFSAGKLNTRQEKGVNVITLEQNAKVDLSDFFIEAERIIFTDGPNRNVRAYNNVYIFDKKTKDEIKAKSFFYDEKSGATRAQGSVALTRKDDDMILRCEYFEQRSDDTIFIKGSIRLMKGDIFIRSDSALYDTVNKTIQFIGRSSVVRDGEKLHSDRMIYNMRTEEIELTGRVNGNRSEI